MLESSPSGGSVAKRPATFAERSCGSTLRDGGGLMLGRLVLVAVVFLSLLVFLWVGHLLTLAGGLLP
jgi:hypothetical protein